MREFFYEAAWNTNNSLDGTYLIESRAWDRSGNVGFSEPLSVTVWNNRPRVLWVPDEFETIQGAINASKDGDTIKVQAGNYHEQLQFFDKTFSLLSESGPEETIIDGTDYYTAAWITGGQDTTTMIRGFTFNIDSQFQCWGIMAESASPRIVNNIFTSTSPEGANLRLGQNAAIVRNNLFHYSDNEALFGGISTAHTWGADFTNNMFVDLRIAFGSRAINGQFARPDFNLTWNCLWLWSAGGDEPILWGENNIDGQEPLFIQGSFRLREGSPGVDQGRPDLRDPDGSTSDIGVYGGPYAY